jgi:hypothetical protein
MQNKLKYQYAICMYNLYLDMFMRCLLVGILGAKKLGWTKCLHLRHSYNNRMDETMGTKMLCLMLDVTYYSHLILPTTLEM